MTGPVLLLGGTLLLDSDITPEHRLLECVRPSLSNLEHYSGRNVGAVMFQVRQQKSKGLAQAVFRKKTSGNHLGLDQTKRSLDPRHSRRVGVKAAKIGRRSRPAVNAARAAFTPRRSKSGKRSAVFDSGVKRRKRWMESGDGLLYVCITGLGFCFDHFQPESGQNSVRTSL